MLDNDKLLFALNSRDAVSGTVLGQQLGVSRVAIQKRIQTLSDNGLPIDAVPGVGYRLPEGVSLLSEQQLSATLNNQLIHSVSLFQSIESTNSYLLTQPIDTGRARLCVAESQSAGRGRRGNEWLSAPYRNVMMSISWGFERWPETITGLGLAVALEVAEYLRESFHVDVQIKWPNDLMVNGAKLAGVLIDVGGESTGACNVVIGLGLNVHQPDWSQGGAYQWQDLSGLGIRCDRNELVSGLANRLVKMLSDFATTGFASRTARWNSLSEYAGKRVRVLGVGDELEGVMRGVDEMGALLIDVDGQGVSRVVDSNVSVRLS
ncbi:bifunctional ligase/repressor BirA [Arenicella chitinivorans]|uniref:Bifunctional ligase/repressor BirA n=1 Tax=Arenicella chitinivorans TaxID=1329800 RepID=A0A918RM10_9GAMM|nr:biotin--[acetyl-CoA-carboxylase] ligase [Arenicella chitinivorans]GHA05272.1 bifunctional ligase/repressor BirA [Arenicella chitinivorans]